MIVNLKELLKGFMEDVKRLIDTSSNAEDTLFQIEDLIDNFDLEEYTGEFDIFKNMFDSFKKQNNPLRTSSLRKDYFEGVDDTIVAIDYFIKTTEDAAMGGNKR